MNRTFIPKLFTVYKKGYSRTQFSKDVISGIIVGIVALPLAIAFAIASGVSPEKGLITAILAGILTVVAYNMSEWKSFLTVSKGPRPDVAVLLVTFFLTVLVDLSIAIQIGMVLSVFLFMRRMSQISQVNPMGIEVEEEDDTDPDSTLKLNIPKGVKIYEITGPFFFGIAHKFKDTMKDINEKPEVLILRMRHVPTIDATALHNLREIIQRLQSSGTKVILSGLQPSVLTELDKARIVFMVGKKNITADIRKAMELVSNKYKIG